MLAAPNKCQIKAKVLALEPSPRFPDKLCFDLQILEAMPIEGPIFRRAGDTCKGFTLEPFLGLTPGRTIAAQAEYIGDAIQGQLRLEQIVFVD